MPFLHSCLCSACLCFFLHDEHISPKTDRFSSCSTKGGWQVPYTYILKMMIQMKEKSHFHLQFRKFRGREQILPSLGPNCIGWYGSMFGLISVTGPPSHQNRHQEWELHKIDQILSLLGCRASLNTLCDSGWNIAQASAMQTILNIN